MPSKDYDWRSVKRGWIYKGDAPGDTQWQKDRLKLFQENGNGWWWYPQNGRKEYRTRWIDEYKSK